MESITIKVETNLAKEIDQAMKSDYSTKTEFIREAIRDKIKEIKKERALYELKKYFGKAKIKTSYNIKKKTIKQTKTNTSTNKILWKTQNKHNSKRR